jgi:4-hydroxybenzoate polyprenyltransferase
MISTPRDDVDSEAEATGRPDTSRRLAGLWLAARPRHWVKNLACFAGLVFSGRMTRAGAIVEAVASFAAFCLAASSVYLLNDVLDRELDRLDPEKRGRPIASGLVPVGLALAGSLGLAIISLLASTRLGPVCLGVLVAYLGLNVAYSAGLKHVVLLDVLIIAFGFVLRVLFGVYAVEVRPTPWVVLCMFFLALFLGFAKRRHELGRTLAEGLAPGHCRPVLRDYEVGFLDLLLGMTASMAILCYALYTITGRPDRPTLVLTVPIVVFGVIRYLLLVMVRGGGGTPETHLITDPVLIATVLLWVAACAAILYLPSLPLFKPIP